MARSPINKCLICGKPIVRMRKVAVADGYYLDWSRPTYCSNACRQRAFRKRQKKARLMRVFGDSL